MRRASNLILPNSECAGLWESYYRKAKIRHPFCTPVLSATHRARERESTASKGEDKQGQSPRSSLCKESQGECLLELRESTRKTGTSNTDPRPTEARTSNTSIGCWIPRFDCLLSSAIGRDSEGSSRLECHITQCNPKKYLVPFLTLTFLVF